MKAVCLLGRGRMEIRELETPQPGAGEVAIQPEFVGLCGTDLHVFLGEFEERVRYPAVLGHEFVGLVTECGEGVEGFRPGERVVVDPVFPCGGCALCRAGRFNVCPGVKVLGIDTAGALAERVVVGARNVYRLPEGLEPRDGVMAELYAVAVHASRMTGIETGDAVVILGAGRLGLSLLDVLRRSGAARIVCVDVLDGRLSAARRLGADIVLNSREVDPVARVMELTGGLGADKVVEAVGHAVHVPGRKPPMYMACEMVRPGGQITAMGQGGAEEAFFWRPFVLKEARIVSSRLNLGDMPRALALLATGALHPGEVMTDTVGPNEVEQGFKMMHETPERVIKVLVEMRGLGGGG